MSDDPIDELGARLFEAARREPPPAGAPERAVTAIRRDLSRPRAILPSAPWLLLPLAATLVAIALWIARGAEPLTPISAEPSAANRSSETSPERSAPPAVATVEPAPVAPPVASSKAPAPARPTPVTLADELEMLKQAQDALAAGDPEHAMGALDHYDRSVKNQRLHEEALLLRIEALSRAGQAETAATLARRFVEQHPESPLVDRARSFFAKVPSAAGGQPQKEE